MLYVIYQNVIILLGTLHSGYHAKQREQYFINVVHLYMSQHVCDCVTFIGATMSVILDLPYTVCIWLSAAVAIIYTLLGGLYSVAYTDIIQLTLIFFSLVSSSLT